MTAGALRRARLAVRVQFGVLGTLCGLWGAHIPSVKARYGLDEAQLAGALFAAAGGAVVSLLFAGRVVGRLGVRGACRLAGLLMCAGPAGALAFDGYLPLLPVMLMFGAGQSLFDVAINTEGTALEVPGGRAVMGGLHGMFSVGGMAGAATAGALLGAVPAVALALYAVVGVGVALVVPILFNAATRVPGVSRAAAIASVSSIGYAGFMVGPPLIGSIAQATTPTHAMAVVAVAAAVLVLGARTIPDAPLRIAG